MIALFNYLYNSIIGQAIAPQHSLLTFWGITFSVGIFPLLGLIFFTENFLRKKNTSTAEFLIGQKTAWHQAETKERITIQSDVQKSDRLVINLDDFLFARSDNNYVSIFYLHEGAFERQLLRLSLKSLEQQLAKNLSIVRCHRSYLVNKSKIKNMEGNARSLNLQIEHYEGLIPVSRSFPKEQLI